MDIAGYIENKIEDSHVTIKEFGDIIIYLLHYGVICKPTSGTHSDGDPLIEKTLYKNYIMVKEEITEYLSVLGMDIYHNEEFESIRIYPPDADYPGNVNEKELSSSSSLMRMGINKDLSASLIILYLLYNQQSRNKLEDFSVVISQIEFMSAFKSKLKLNLAEKLNKTSKEELFRELKRLRVIKYHKDFFESEQYPIVIRPLIFDLVPQRVVKDTLEQYTSNNTDDITVNKEEKNVL